MLSIGLNPWLAAMECINLFPATKGNILVYSLCISWGTIDRWMSFAHLPVPFHVFSDVDSLLDEVVQILGEVGGHALLLQYPQDLVSCDKAHLGHTMGVTKDDTCYITYRNHQLYPDLKKKSTAQCILWNNFVWLAAIMFLSLIFKKLSYF